MAVVLAACSSSSSNTDTGEQDAGTVDSSFPDTAGGSDTGGGFDTSTSFDSSLPETSISDNTAPPPDVKPQCNFNAGDSGNDAGDASSEGGTGLTSSETEPNDTAATANTMVLNGVECASIAPATDVDFFKYTLPASAAKMLVTFDGYIKLTFTVGSDAPVTVTPTSFPSIGFHPGSEYTVQVTSFDGNPQTYAIIITTQ